MLRNRILRLLEPLGAPDEEETWFPSQAVPEPGLAFQTDSEISPRETEPASGKEQSKGVDVRISHVDLVLGGKIILQDINLEILPGEHVGIIGPSGAGKSSLAGLLLGWHRPAAGKILVDGENLDGQRVKMLRQETAWVDPAVQLWNWSLYENLRFGNEKEDLASIGQSIQEADLFSMLERLPEGLKTQLGEGGGLVSGGEGQRVRLGRALVKKRTRLVILDEPFRGLDRETRRRLLRQAGEHWQDVTMLCITHDVAETMNFQRVIVIEDGRLVEQGSPTELAEEVGSRYRSLLDGEKAVHEDLWSSEIWQRWVVEDGKVDPGN